MKKILSFLLSVLLIATMAACSPKAPESGENTDVVSGEQNNEDTASEKESEQESEKDSWGVTENIVVDANNDLLRVFVNFTDYIGPTRGTGKLATQKDSSVMILDGQVNSKITIESGKVEDIFPAYFEQTKFIMDAQYMGRRKDYEFTVDSKENVTINGYEMCKFTGTHTYGKLTEAGTFSEKFVSYATKTKQNDAFVYWMVLDGTEDGSLGNKLESLGKKMAESFREE